MFEQGKELVANVNPSAVDVSGSAPTVIGEERFQQILTSLNQRETIRDDKGRQIPFKGDTKDHFISACKTAYPVIKKTYEGINELGRVLAEVRDKLRPLGVYYAWLAFINLPKRTAQNYVQVYNRYGDHLPAFTHLGIRKLLIASKLENCTDYVAKNLARMEEETAEQLATQINSLIKKEKKSRKSRKTKKAKKRDRGTPSKTLRFADCTIRASSKGDRITIEGLTKESQAKLIDALNAMLSQDKESGGHGGRLQNGDILAGLDAPVGTADESVSEKTTVTEQWTIKNVIPANPGSESGAGPGNQTGTETT